MDLTNTPPFTPVPFANSGTKNTIPTPSQVSIKPGAASFTDGFPPVTFLPIASGGVPPFGADVNGILYGLSVGERWSQAGGRYAFDATFATSIGGYPIGAQLLRADGIGYWMSVVNNNTANPDTGGAGWVAVRANNGSATIAMFSGNNVPTQAQLAAQVLLLTGAPSLAATLTLPLVAGSQWIVANNTTGAGTVTIQGATGPGLSIAQSTSLSVYTDGVGFFPIAAPATGSYLPLTGTAVAATKLATARTINGVAFDGTANITLPVGGAGTVTSLSATSSNGVTTTVTNSTTTPNIAVGLGAITPTSVAATGTVTGSNLSGTNTGDQINITGNAGTATTLATARTINGVLFDGSSNITIPTGSSGTVTSVSVTTANGISGTVATATTTPAITLALGAITPTTVTASGAITCTTMNATSSDRRLKRDIRRVAPRPIHRFVPFVAYNLKANGAPGLGAIAQTVQKFEPIYVGEFETNGGKRLSIDKQSMAYEQAMWAGHELDRQAKMISALIKRIEKLERSR